MPVSLLPILCLLPVFAAPPSTDAPPPRLDGLDEEWRSIAPAVTDPTGDHGGGVLDLRSMQLR